MLLSEVDNKVSNSIGLFLKFANNKKHLENLQDGNVRMSNLQYYINLENSTGIKGIGDKNEATLVIRDVDIKLHDGENDVVLDSFYADEFKMSFNEHKTRPVFCLTYIDADSLRVIVEKEHFYRCKVEFTEAQKKQMAVDFGEYVLAINSKSFLQQLIHTCRHGSEYYNLSYHPVSYDDFDVPNVKRFEAFRDTFHGPFFWKGIEYSHQCEFRAVLLNKEIKEDEPFTLKPNRASNQSAHF